MGRHGGYGGEPEIFVSGFDPHRFTSIERCILVRGCSDSGRGCVRTFCAVIVVIR
jgi:hypothetical protein